MTISQGWNLKVFRLSSCISYEQPNSQNPELDLSHSNCKDVCLSDFIDGKKNQLTIIYIYIYIYTKIYNGILYYSFILIQMQISSDQNILAPSPGSQISF